MNSALHVGTQRLIDSDTTLGQQLRHIAVDNP
jgi:hypothetical protein